MERNISLFWIRDDKDTRKMLLQYASKFGETFPDAAEILAAVDDEGNLLGFSAILSTEVISDILVFHVEPGESLNDIGHLMLQEIEKVMQETGIGMLRYIMPRDESMMLLFADEGYDMFGAGREYAVLYASLTYSDVYRRNVQAEPVQKARSISQCKAKEQKILKDYFIENSIATMDFFNPVLSSVVFEGAKVAGLVLCETKPKGIIIYHMYAEADHPEYIIDCLRVMDVILSEYGAQDEELMLSFATGNETEVDLIHYLAGNVVPVEDFVRESIALKVLKAM